MKRFPAEFEALLSPAGRRLLKGKHPAKDVLLRGPFYSSDELLDPKPLPACTKLLAKAFTDLLEPIERALPAPNLSPRSYEDTLPKVGRMQSVPMHGPQQLVALERAKEVGLFEMMYSQSYRAFCEALAGEAPEGPQTPQVLRSRPPPYGLGGARDRVVGEGGKRRPPLQNLAAVDIDDAVAGPGVKPGGDIEVAR